MCKLMRYGLGICWHLVKHKRLVVVQVPMANRKIMHGFHLDLSPNKPSLLHSLKNIWIKETDLPFIPIFLVQKVALAPLQQIEWQSVLILMCQGFNDRNFIEWCVQQLRRCLCKSWLYQMERRQRTQERWVAFARLVAISQALYGYTRSITPC